jgi:hypothetical protein
VNPPPRRLVLSAEDFDALVRRAGVRLPPPFDTTRFDPTELDTTVAEKGEVHPSVRANLSVLARPDLLVRLDASVPAGDSRAVFAVAGPLGASLFAQAAGSVELSMFAAADLGRELIRGVPRSGDEPAARVHESLAPGVPDTPPWRGQRVGRTALAEYGSARRLFGAADAAAALGLAPDEADLVAELTDRTRGSLRALVHGRPHGADRAVLVGQVVWVATDLGWVELVPSNMDGSGGAAIELELVTRELIGTRLAPMIAQVLSEVRDDAA